MDHLSAPWRSTYIRSLENKGPGDAPGPTGCFLCDAGLASGADEQGRRLVLWTGPRTVVLMNKFPYTSGHLLVAPREHKHDLDQLDDEELIEMQRQTRRAIALLREKLNPQGFNIGINLGRAAGAGVPGHLHQHIVPRWAGDVNFMSVVGEVRILPHALSDLWAELRPHDAPSDAPLDAPLHAPPGARSAS